MHRNGWTRIIAVLLTVGTALAQQQPAESQRAAEQPPVTFEADVNFVEVPTIVTDRNGDFVRGLSADDFEVFEDGERQTITVFSLVDLPVLRPFTPVYAEAPVDADVHETRPTFDGRLYVLMLDDLHTSALRTQQVRQYAKRFVEQSLGANDLAAVLYTGGQADGQELTSRRSLLLQAIDRFQGRKLPSATGDRLGVHLQLQRDEEMSFDDPELVERQRPITSDRGIEDPNDTERVLNARNALGALNNVAEWMANVRGRRKAIVLFSEGLDYDIYAPFNRRGSLILRYARDAIAAAQRANVSIYAVDARGLTRLPAEAINTRGLSQDPNVFDGAALGYQREVLMSQESLIALADETGGLAVVGTNDVEGGMDRIVRENSTYYLLGYATDPDRDPGEFREIEVRVSHPDVRVNARRGFVPRDPAEGDEAQEVRADQGSAKASPAFDVAMNTLLPVGELQFRVSAAPFMGTDPTNASVLVIIEIDGRSLKFKEVDGRFSERIELSIVALDYDGEIHDSDDQAFDLNLRPQTYEVVSRNGVRLYSRLELPPKRYQIRVGVHEAVGSAGGAVPFELELPDYSETPFALSGLVLTSTGAASMPTPRPDPQLAELFSTPPSATRVFHPQEIVSMFVELYSSASSSRHRVDFLATVRDASDGRTVFTLRDDRTIEPSDEPQALGYGFDVPLRDLTPGMYVLRAEAASRATDDLVYREVPFEIRDSR